MIRLAIAEDHQSLIDGIELLLAYNENIKIVGTANDGEALLNLVKGYEPDVVLTDIRMPKIDGISATKLIKTTWPHIKVIAFTMFDQDEAVKQMLKAGANGYLLKNSPLADVLKAIKVVHEGGSYYDTNIKLDAEDNGNKNTNSLLTNRQMEILELIGQGKTSQEIAEDLFIGIHTVDTHRKNMIRILGLHGKGELLRYALERKYRF